MTPLFISWVCDQCSAGGPAPAQELTIDQVFLLPLGTLVKILRVPDDWASKTDLLGWSGEFVEHHKAWLVLRDPTEPTPPIKPKVYFDSTAPYARELRFCQA